MKPAFASSADVKAREAIHAREVFSNAREVFWNPREHWPNPREHSGDANVAWRADLEGGVGLGGRFPKSVRVPQRYQAIVI